MKKMATLRVSAELLIQALNLPPTTRIHEARFDGWHGRAEFLVEHEGLREVGQGEEIPECLPTFVRQEPVRFLGWGQRKEEQGSEVKA